MASNGEHSDDSIRQAASDSVRKGDNIRERIRDLTLGTLTSRRFDREAIRDTMRAITEGVSAGAEGSGAGTRHSLAEAFRGMDQALTKTVEAGQEAIKQLVDTGRSLSDREVEQAFAGLKKIEEDFLDTVSQVAESASERVGPDLKDIAGRATRAGTETGRKTATAMGELTRQMAGSSMKLATTGIELAGEFGLRFAQIASGVLAGMADTLDKPAADKASSEARKPS